MTQKLRIINNKEIMEEKRKDLLEALPNYQVGDKVRFLFPYVFAGQTEPSIRTGTIETVPISHLEDYYKIKMENGCIFSIAGYMIQNKITTEDV